MRQLVVNLAVIDRPLTTEKCIKQFIECSKAYRDQIVWIVQDQNSNDQTRSMLKAYQKEFDMIFFHDHNIGCCFEINRAMSLCEPHQHFLDLNADVHLYSGDWFDVVMSILGDEDVGVVAGRRDDFWIDRPEKFAMYKSGVVVPEKRHGLWCELVTNGLIIGPFWCIKNTVIEKIGYMNEKNLIDDIDYYHRVKTTGLKSLYIPHIFIHQPQEEEQKHPQYGSHRGALDRTTKLFQEEMIRYLKGDVYRGTKWYPETMRDEDYKTWSEFNWKWLKNWPNV